jgi:D-tyrosyl-tRNA(Tyr) deacylase
MVLSVPGQLLKTQCGKSGLQYNCHKHAKDHFLLFAIKNMRTLIQRVTSGKVTVAGNIIAEIGHGLIILLAICKRDTEDQARFLAEKIATLRIFEDSASKFNLSIRDVNGAAIVVSQFTLYGDTRQGRRPSFIEAARPEVAAPLVEKFTEFMRSHGIPSQTGIFGAHMLVEIQNDGPVTFYLEK